MKHNFRVLIVLFALFLLCACNGVQQTKFKSDNSAFYPIEITMNIPSKYKVSEWSDYPYATSYNICYSAGQEEFDKENDVKTYISHMLISIITYNAEVEQMDDNRIKEATPTTTDMKKFITSTVEVISSIDFKTNGYEAFLLNYKRDSSANKNYIEFFVSNNKTTEDDYFGITIFGPYTNEEEKQMILDAIDSLKIQVG